MSKLFKSKFLLGVMTFAVMFAGAAALRPATASANHAVCSNFTMTLRYGMRNTQVLCLQQMLNDKGFHVDGTGAGSAGLETTFYGNATVAAVKVMQHAIDGTADGIFGPMSRAALLAYNGGPVYPGPWPAGCSSAAGYSSTTGLPCSGSPIWPAGCASGSGYSSTTGMPCSGPSSLPAGCATASGYSSTTGQPCTTTTVNTGTNGYLADLSLDSTGRVSTVYEGQQDQVVAGFRATARLSSQKVDRVRVTFCNDTVGGGVCVNSGSTSSNLSRYISGASLWYGATKLATIAVTDADRATSSDVYTFNFSGLNASIPRDQIGRFYVSVNANGSLDSNDTTANWVVKFTAGGISASSPDGSYDTYPSADLEQSGLMFGKFSQSGVKSETILASDNPAASTVAVNATAVTNNVTVLKFGIKATNSNLTLRKVPIQITFASGGSTPLASDNIVKTINAVRLMQGTNVVDSVDPSASIQFTPGSASNATGTPCTDSAAPLNDTCTFFFSNLSSPYNMIASGTTGNYSVVVDFKAQGGNVTPNYQSGSTLTTSFVNADVLVPANYSVQDTNGDQLAANSSVRIGSAVGNIMTLLINGANVTQGAATISQISDTAGIITSVTYDIPLTVTAFGQTLYVGQAAELANPPSNSSGATAKAFSFVLQDSAAPAVDITAAPAGTTVTTTLSSSDALIEGNAFRLDSGTAKHFTMQVIISCSAASCAGATTANYRVNTVNIRTDVESSLENVVTPLVNQALLPRQSYQTGYHKIK